MDDLSPPSSPLSPLFMASLTACRSSLVAKLKTCGLGCDLACSLSMCLASVSGEYLWDDISDVVKFRESVFEEL